SRALLSGLASLWQVPRGVGAASPTARQGSLVLLLSDLLSKSFDEFAVAEVLEWPIGHIFNLNSLLGSPPGGFKGSEGWPPAAGAARLQVLVQHLEGLGNQLFEGRGAGFLDGGFAGTSAKPATGAAGLLELFGRQTWHRQLLTGRHACAGVPSRGGGVRLAD